MSLTSVGFLAFVGIVVLLYYMVPLRFRWFVLLCASMYFIISANGIKLSLVMGITVLATYGAGRELERKKSKIVLIAIIVFNTVVLIYLKEVNFFIRTIQALGEVTGHSANMSIVDLLAPLGISYYTLNMISYVLDVYWGTGRVQKNLFKFMLFSGYFPIMVSGPIVRYREVEATLYNGHKLNYQNICFGLQRILWGLFKKLVIAGRLGVIVNTVYGNYHTYAGCYVFVAMIFIVLEVYTDFSACIDIVLGVSELFGIVLPENFQTPFLARSVSEFWRRWHITLGAWLKDYLLYPILKSELWQKMGRSLKKQFGKKVKKIPVWLGLFVTWFIIGFWHGGSWNYIIGVGLFMWILIVMEEVCEPIFEKITRRLRINTECIIWKTFQRLRTFFCFAIGMSLFRSHGGFIEGVRIWKAAFKVWNPEVLVDGSLLNLGLDISNMRILVLALMVLGIGGIMREIVKKPIRVWLAEQNLILRWGALYTLIFAVLIFGEYGVGYDTQSFIYQGF